MNNFVLHNGDCLEVMESLADNSVDCVIADPPYGTTACKWDSVIPFEPMWKELYRISKPTAAILLFGSQPFSSALVMSNPKDFRHEWIWIKNRGSNFANTVREPMKEHETILCFGRGKWTYNKQLQSRAEGGLSRTQYQISNTTKTENYGQFGGVENVALPTLRVPSSWQKFNTEVGLHPTQKPLELMRYLVLTYSNPGDAVLDFTMGSGTTGAACAIEGRQFIGIEKDATAFEIAEARIKRANLIPCDAPKREVRAVDNGPQESLFR